MSDRIVELARQARLRIARVFDHRGGRARMTLPEREDFDAHVYFAALLIGEFAEEAARRCEDVEQRGHVLEDEAVMLALHDSEAAACAAAVRALAEEWAQGAER